MFRVFEDYGTSVVVFNVLHIGTVGEAFKPRVLEISMGMSIAPVSASRAKYYTDAVAKGKDDYGSGLGEAPPTRFHGRTDGIFETPEEVPLEDVAKTLQIQDGPDRRKNVAFDLTCSVPKSVSDIWAMADDDTRAIVERHLRIAAESAIGSMHWYVRAGHAGKIRFNEFEGKSKWANLYRFAHSQGRGLVRLGIEIQI